MEKAEKITAKNFKLKARLNFVFCFLALAVLVLGAVYAVITRVNEPMAVMTILTPIVAALFLGAIILGVKFIKSTENESLHDGVRLVIESIPIVSSLVDREGSVVYCNEEAPKLFDFATRKEYLDNWFNIMPAFQPDGSASQEKLDDVMREAFRTGRATFELMQKKLNGEPVPCDFTLVRINIQGKPYLLEFTRDLRETYAVRAKEESLLRRMEIILDTSPLVFALFDENSLPVQVNKRAEEVFQISDKQIFLDNVERFWPELQPDGTPSMEEALKAVKVAFERGSYSHEFRYQTLDGTQIPMEEILQKIDIDGKNFLVTYLRDLRDYYKMKDAEVAAQKKLNVILERLNEHLETQVTAISESSSSIEEMIANIQAVIGTLSRNSQNMEELQSASTAGHSSLNNVISDIKEIAAESQSLLEINSVMENIASQTNLLSMNAAIEAAHAGESGRGFAVVASEIRKLAESSSKQSNTIGAVLKKIKGSIDKIGRSTDTVMNKFQDIDGKVKTVVDQESSILDAMTEQGAGSSQILQAIAQVNEITSMVKQDANLMVEAASKLDV